MEKAIEASRLWKIFGRDVDHIELNQETISQLEESDEYIAAVCDMSFSVNKGEVFVVMGLSGSGKSTLIRCPASPN